MTLMAKPGREREEQTAKRRMARHYLEVLRRANEQHHGGHAGSEAGLQLFDVEAHNIRSGWRWARDHRQSDRVAAELCCLYPARGAYIVSLRLPAKERLAWFEEGLNAARGLDQPEAVLMHFEGMANALVELGEYGAAVECYRRILRLGRAIPDTVTQLVGLVGLGKVAIEREDGDDALVHLEEALRLAEAHPELDALQWSSVLLNLCSAYGLTGRFSKALELARKARTLGLESGDLRGLSKALLALASSTGELDDHEAAQGFLNEQLEVARRLGDRRTEAEAVWNLAISHRRAGDVTLALGTLETSLRLMEEVDHPRTAEVRIALAEWRADHDPS